MFIGAHPDDADMDFGGTAILLKQLGHEIIFVSVTDGSAGHQTMDRKALAVRRRAETQKVAEFLGVTYVVRDAVDGELVADIPTRKKLIKLIREYKPDVVISPRPADYHPDHRAVGELVQDSSYLLTVPLVCPETPRLERNPYIFHHQDDFSSPTPFKPEILIDITSVFTKKMESLTNHESQVFEWLPFIESIKEPVPETPAERIEFLKQQHGFMTSDSSRFIPLFNKPDVQQVEALERSEYGSKVTPEIAKKLFPFAKVNLSKLNRGGGRGLQKAV